MSVLAEIDRTELSAEDLADLQALDAIFEANPLEAYNNPWIPEVFPSYKVHRKQMDFHAIKNPPMGIKALIAGNRSGKTVACVVDDIIQLIPEELCPKHLLPFKKWFEPIVIWVGAPKNDVHFKNTVPLFRRFMPKRALIDGQFGKSFKSQPAPELRLVNGSVVAFKSYDMDLDAWAAAEVHRIHWDEEPNTANSRELRTEANSRLVSTDGDEVIGMTPLLGMSWVHEEVWEQRDENPLVSVVQMDVADNPWNSPETIEKWAARMTKEEKRMRLHGEFVHLGGLFYGEFSEHLHVLDKEVPIDHLKGQDVVIGIDPGKNTAVVWVCFDKENSALVFDEFCPSGAIVEEVAAEIKRRNEEWGVKEPTFVIDPTSRNESSINRDEIAAAYSRHGIDCEWGQNSRHAGIMEVKRRLQDKDARGKAQPSLLFSPKCRETIKQHRRYRRDPKAADEWKAVQQTDTVRFDACDATRYSIMSRTYDFLEPGDISKEPYVYNPEVAPSLDLEEFMVESAPLGEMS